MNRTESLAAWRRIELLEKLAAELKERLEVLEAKRGPGRPRTKDLENAPPH